MKSNYIFQNKKNLMRREAWFSFLQISLISGLKEDNWIFRFAFTFNQVQCVVWLKYRKKSQPHRDIQLEKEVF